MDFYQKLPSYKNSREVYSKFIMSENEYAEQAKKNIFYMVDIAECAIRQLLKPEMSPEEKVFYYKKAAGLYETVLDGKYGGVYDVPLIFDYGNIAVFLMQKGDETEASEYIDKLIRTVERHTDTSCHTHSSLLHDAEYPKAPVKEQSIKKILSDLQRSPELKSFRPSLTALYEKYLNSR